MEARAGQAVAQTIQSSGDVRPKLGSIWLMARADKRYGFDVIPDLRLETELDPSR